jgi:hypothetical protein
MFYNRGWGNLIQQQSNYTHAFAAEAAQMLEEGESL